MGPKWHVVVTKIREEDTAIESLMSQMYEVFAPKLTVENKDGGLNSQWAFEGYIFVCFDPDVQSAATINYSYGVSRLLTFGNVLATINDKTMEALKARFETAPVVRSLASSCAQAGESVTINSGPFRHMQAIFLEPNGTKRSLIMLNLLGADRPIVVDNSHISR